MRRSLCYAVLLAVGMAGLLGFAFARPAADTLRDSTNLRYGVAGTKGRVLDKGYFVINYSDRRRCPYWSAYHLTAKDLKGTAKRRDNFRPDIEVPEKARSSLEDYRGKSFDRGHLAPARDFTRSKEAMAATFLLSNISPQYPNTNQGIWQELEGQIRDMIRDVGEAWVVTGDAFMSRDSQQTSPKLWMKQGRQNRVAVPTPLFDAILTQDGKGRWCAYAFLIPNQPERNTHPTSRYLLSVDRLEQITGFDFFVELDTAVQNRIESAVPVWSW
jgi:endonuclease G, mitochondrial